MSKAIRSWLGMGVLACASLLLLAGFPPDRGASVTGAATAKPAPAPAVLQPARLPLAFEPVAGGDAGDGYVARGLSGDLRLAADGARFRASAGNGATAVIGMHVVGAAADAPAEALEPQPGRSHYFVGNDPAQWRRDVVRHGKVRYAGVYPGIDLVYYGNQRDLEYDFVVAPGADPSPIAVRFSGVDGLRLDAAGNLLLSTPAGELVQRRPVVYQQVDGRRVLVDAAYALRDGVVGFVLGEYDRALSLVIDPVITYSTYIGGKRGESGRDVAVDAHGYFYVTGWTDSEDFPLVAAPQGTGGGDGNDIFVVKYAPDGSVVYSTYLASSRMEKVGGIAVDDAGHAYLVGFTDGPDFPVANPIQSGPNSPDGRAVFVTRIAPEGDELLFSTYLGGGADYGEAIAVDNQGHAWITGKAGYHFPTTPGVIDPTTQWGDDAFVARIDTLAGALVYSTYIDGPDTGSTGRAIAVDAAGNAYIGGNVSGAYFPIVNGFQPQRADFNGDAFVAKLNHDGSALLYSTYYGGTTYDFITGIDIDGQGNAYVAGLTWSLDLPLKGAFQTTSDQYYYNAFVAKVDTVGDGGLVYASYLGGSRDEGPRLIDIAVDATGSAYVAGSTYSVTDFPVVDPIHAPPNGSQAGFLVRVAPDGGSLLFGTFIGAEKYSTTQVDAVAVDRHGNAYVTGTTDGEELPMVDAAQPQLNDNYRDAFVMRIAVGEAAPDRPGPASDFDGDGRDDVTWRHGVSGANTIWLGADATRQRRMTGVRNTDWEVAGIGDFDGDGMADVFWRNAANGTNVVWPGADSSAQWRASRITNLDWRIAGTGDLDGDGTDDLVWRNGANGANAVWYSASHDARQALTRVGNLAWRITGIGDFDGDGRDDILWRNVQTGANTYWPGGDAAQPARMTRITNLAWQVVDVGDYDGDGVDDVTWREAETGANVAWLGADRGRQLRMARVRNLDWRIEASGDYDGDGRDDLFWRNAVTGANTVWLGADAGATLPTRRVSDTRWHVVP